MNPASKLVDYLRQSREEVKKVSWPSRKDTIRYSALVIGASVLMAVFFAGLDTGFQAGWSAIINAKTSAANQIDLTQENASSSQVQVQTQPASTTPTAPSTPNLNDAKPIETPDANKK